MKLCQRALERDDAGAHSMRAQTMEDVKELEECIKQNSKCVVVFITNIKPDGTGTKILKGNHKNQHWSLEEAQSKLEYFSKEPEYPDNGRVMYMFDMSETEYFCIDSDLVSYGDVGKDYRASMGHEFLALENSLICDGTQKGYHMFYKKQDCWDMSGIPTMTKINKKWELDLITQCVLVNPDAEFDGGIFEWELNDMAAVFDNGLPKPRQQQTGQDANVKITETTWDATEFMNERVYERDMGDWSWQIEQNGSVKFWNSSGRCCSEPDHVHDPKQDHSCVFFNKGMFLTATCWSHDSRKLRISSQNMEYLRNCLGIEDIVQGLSDDLAKVALEDKLMISRNDINDSVSLCEKIRKVIWTKLRFSKGKWYALEETNLWKQIQEPHYVIQKVVRTGLHNNRKELAKQLDEKDTDENIAELKGQLECFKLIDRPSFTTQVKKTLMCLINDDEFETKLDVLPYKIAYKNGIWNIKSNTFTEGFTPDDYITQTLDFNYEPETSKADEEWILEKIWSIMNRSIEHRDYLLETLGYALSGNPEKYQQFYNWVGQKAGNGKSTIMEVLEKSYPIYVGKGDTQIIEADYSKKHKLIPMFEKRRIVHLAEMDKKKKIDAKMFKLLSEGGSIDCEELFATTKTYNINAKPFLVSNHTINFNNCDKGCERRLMHVQFNMSFRDTFKEDNIARGEFVADLGLTDKMVNRKQALMKVLMRYAHKVYNEGMMEVPQEFAAEKAETIATNTESNCWFTDNLEVVEGEKTAKATILQAYTEDTGKKMSNSEFRDTMKALGYFKYYEPQEKITVDGKRLKGVFVGIKLVSNDEDGESIE